MFVLLMAAAARGGRWRAAPSEPRPPPAAAAAGAARGGARRGRSGQPRRPGGVTCTGLARSSLAVIAAARSRGRGRRAAGRARGPAAARGELGRLVGADGPARPPPRCPRCPGSRRWSTTRRRARCCGRRPARYSGPVVLTKPLTIDGGGQVTIDGGGKGTVFVLETSGATLRGAHLHRLGRLALHRRRLPQRARQPQHHRRQPLRRLPVRRRPEAVEREPGDAATRSARSGCRWAMRGDAHAPLVQHEQPHRGQRGDRLARHGGLVLERQPDQGQHRHAAAATRSTSCTRSTTSSRTTTSTTTRSAST